MPHYIDPVARQRAISQNSIDQMNHAQYIKNVVGLDQHYQAQSDSNPYVNIMLNAPYDCAHWQPNDYWSVVVNAYGWTAPASCAGPILAGLRAYGYYGNGQYLYFVERAITNIMQQSELYAHEHFITFMQWFNWYEDELLALHDKVSQKKSFYASFFEKNVSEKALVGITSEHQRIICKREEIKKHEAEKSITADNFQKNLVCVEEMVDEQQELYDIAHTYNLHNKNHYATRLVALEDVVSNSRYTHEAYTLDDEVMKLLSESGCDSKQYTTNYGNQLQQVIHRECDDYRLGKGIQGIKIAIPFEGCLKTAETLLKHLNK